jgi:hypothetical protein
MEKNLIIQDSKIPTIQELYKDVALASSNDKLTVLLNQPPPPKWIVKDAYIANYYYLPIGKIEFLLKKIFKSYKIEITNQGQSFNGVWVTVRVHYLNPVSNEWHFHDGIGAKELQVKSGSSPSQLENINNGALGMAFPIAKTRAVKDACDHFGTLFGSDLNRKDNIQITQDEVLLSLSVSKENERLELLIDKAADTKVLEALKQYVTDDLQNKYNEKWLSLK